MADSGLTIEDAYRLGDSAEDAALPADGDAAGAAADRVALRFVSKLTARPQEITDRDITSLLDHFSEYQVAEIVYHTGLAATLNRLTETAGLALVELDSTPGRK
jgi:alkylhydroperoxidase family enzyme